MAETEKNNSHLEFIDKGHALLKDFPGQIKEFRFGTASPSTTKSIKAALDFLPTEQQPDLRINPDHQLRVATLIKDSKSSIQDKEAYFYLPGSVGTPAGAAPSVAEVMKAVPQIELGATFSSYASADTWGDMKDGYPRHPFERAAQIAGIITETLKQNPSPTILLEGTSMGGMDMFLASLVLQSMIDKGDLNTKIGGFIFNQAGGLYDQDKLQFLGPRKDEHVSAKKEVQHLYPNKENFADVETALEKAKEAGDAPKVLRLQTQLHEMVERVNIPPYLSGDQIAHLNEMDNAINELYFGGSNKSLSDLLEERQKYLKNIIDPLQGKGVVTGAETRTLPDGGIPALNWVKNLVPSILVPKFGVGLATKMPRELREQAKFPIAIVSGEIDAYFKPSEVENSVSDEQLQLRQQNQGSAKEGDNLHGYFPNSPHLFMVDIANWPHNGILVNPEKNAEIKADIFRRMENPPSTHSSKLHYVS
jgi:pimeloyl-ACP methyl ester carboxylesterase